jgi:hypothetical protein
MQIDPEIVMASGVPLEQVVFGIKGKMKLKA